MVAMIKKDKQFVVLKYKEGGKGKKKKKTKNKAKLFLKRCGCLDEEYVGESH